MFIRYLEGNSEVLVNVKHITRIEVKYAVPETEDRYRQVSLDQGLEDPSAVRWYTVHVAGEVLPFTSDPDSPVMKVLEDIYKNAVKG